ncbi:MFS transporter [Nocardia jejuensis]|uniref:MFS transporter n=1 Tax=Nocardia jejuensis TaxID=328049 RepID=UPI00082B887C|nr:MFS transporter [Nocardia jejuensis]
MAIDTEHVLEHRILRTPVVMFMALAAAFGTATTYPLQPAIANVADSLGVSVSTIGFALAGGPLGYMCGLALLVPLVDRMRPRILLCAQFTALAVALLAAAAARSVWVLGLAMVAIGAASSVGAALSSLAGRLAEPRRRATVLGIVTAGISAGILAGRMVGGWLSDAVGWRGMLAVLAVACAVIAAASVLLIPVVPTRTVAGYLATLRSMPGLFRRFPALRLAASRGALWFFAFCTVWAGIAVALSQPPYSYSAEHIGWYAAAGILGIVATRVAGAWTDRVGARRVILIGLVLTVAATALLSVALSNVVLTVIALAVFDAGLFAAQVANQSTVLAIDPSAPARFNGAYMLVYFIGGSAGTAFGAAAAGAFGWSATAMFTMVALVFAIALTVFARTGAPTRI